MVLLEENVITDQLGIICPGWDFKDTKAPVEREMRQID